MKRTHLPLNALRVFDAAARHLSFTRAADELAVTPAAVGQQIRALEDMLGVVLFRRTSKGLELAEEASAGLELLTILEVAALLKISAPTVRRLQQQRHISFFKVGGRVRFTRSDIDAYLRKRRVSSIDTYK